MASTYIQRINGTPDSRKKFTFSVWVKRAKLGTYQYIHGFQDNGVSDPRMTINFRDDDSFEYTEVNSTGDALGRLRPSMKFRDTSAWYAITVAVDTTLATADDRIKIWVNGEQQTSISVRVNYTQNFDTCINDNRHTIGAIYNTALSGYFDGSLSHYHYCDGYAYQASDFGETDATTGIWKPKTAPSVTYGTNGCFLKFENSGAFGTDSSGNSNNFTVNGTMTQTIDTPSNVFATMNPLASQSGSSSSSSAFTFSNGNLSVSNLTSETGIANLGVSTGKWFWEVKVITDQAGLAIGACNDGQNLDDELGYQSGSSQSNAKVFGYYGDNGNKYTTMGDGSQMSAYGSAISVNDIVGVAMNLDDNQVTFYLNGSSQGTFSITALGDGETYFPAVGNYSAATIAVDFNFGNGYFGTTAVSSAQNPDDGIGIFEYDVPTGYYALNTKAINAQEYD